MPKIPFYSYWLARTCIALADVIYIMVITTFIYDQTGSALIASLFPLFKAMSVLIAGFTSPLLYEKFRFSKLLIVLQVLKAVLVIILLLGFGSITAHIYVLLIFVLLISFIEGAGNPLLFSVMPQIVSRDELVKANSLLSITIQSAQIAGYSFTGFVVIYLGHHITLSFNAGLLMISIISLYIMSRYLRNTPEPKNEKQSKWSVIKEGWVLLWRNRTLRVVTMMDVLEGIAGSIWIGAITLVYVKEALHQGENWWGLINASYYVGSIIGGICTLFLAKFIQKHLILSMAIGSFLFSIFTLIYGLTSFSVLALVLCVAMGPAYQIRDVAQQTAFQTNIEATKLPKIYASQKILLSVVTSLSIVIVGFIADFIGIRAVYIFGSVLIFISAALSFALVQASKKATESSNQAGIS
jgi:MFS family permease